MTVAEKERKIRICRIQELLSEGYPAIYVKNLIGVSYNTIRRYKEGDPDLLCRFPERQGVRSVVDKYKEFIIDSLNKKMSGTAILKEINKHDPTVRKTAFFDYCNQCKEESGINNRTNTVGKELIVNPSKRRSIKRKDILMRLWMRKDLDDTDFSYVSKKFDVVQFLENFIFDFYSVFMTKDKKMLTGFIEIYEEAPFSKIRSFIKGMLMDIDAIENAVELPYSNGFVEGNNNRLKTIKRLMYGRAGLLLLKIKVLFGG